MQLKMSFTMEKVLADARMLVNRLKEHDSAADNLIAVTQTMYRRVDSMRQYQEDLNELNEIARHRPRSNLILSLMQENSQIRELQQENKELRGCLEEHQSALELIMSKYREQMFKLVMANKMDKKSKDQPDGAQDVEDKLEKICEMAAIMQKAIRIDETEAIRDREHMAQLETENKTLRELLLISYSSSQEVSRKDRGVQANMGPVASLDSSGHQDTDSLGGGGATTDEDEHHFLANDMNASVIENKSFVFGAPDKASSPVGTWGRETTASVSSDTTSSSSSSSHNDSIGKISLKDVAVSVDVDSVSSSSQSNHPDGCLGNPESGDISGNQGIIDSITTEGSKSSALTLSEERQCGGQDTDPASCDSVKSASNSLTVVNSNENSGSSSSC